MRQIVPPLPADLRTKLIGCIVESDDRFDLGQDMLQVDLPNGILITAGWYPESSANGVYRVSVTRGLSVIVDPVFTRLADQAAQDVALFAVRFRDSGFTAESESSFTEFVPPSAYGKVFAFAA